MGTIIACIDGSKHAEHVCKLSAWAAEQLGQGITLLHVAEPHEDMTAKPNLCGAIGLGAKSGLKAQLAEQDAVHGKEQLKKGQAILEQAQGFLGATKAEVLHRRGHLDETLAEFEGQAELVVLGKCGERNDAKPHLMGSQIERVARGLNKPLLLATKQEKKIERVLIAYDGSPSAQKALEFICENPLFKDLECHLLFAGKDTPENQAILDAACDKLEAANLEGVGELDYTSHIEAAVSVYEKEHEIDLLIMGAYGHSKVRSLVLGSTTSALIKASKLPVILVR